MSISSDAGDSVDAAAVEDATLLDTNAPDTVATDSAPSDSMVEEVQIPDSVAPIDASPEPGDEFLTWFQCRHRMVKGQITPAETKLCADLHSEDPGARHYGIRWIFIDENVNPEEWIAPRLKVLNDIFAPASFTFSTASIVVIKGSVIEDPAVDGGLSWNALADETAQHFGGDTKDPAEVFAALKTKLQEEGVADGALEAISLEKPLTAKEYFGTIARARPTELHVIVSPLLNGKSGGGLSSGPGTNPTQGRVSVVYHRSADTVAMTVLAHEMGHFFGLKHPQTKLQEKADVAEADFAEIVKKSPFPADEQLDALKGQLGPDLQGDPTLLYPVWNGTQKNTMQPFERYRYALSLMWLTKDYLYRSTGNGPKGFKSTANFVKAGQEGTAMFYKNFGWPGNGDNSGWNVKQELFTCSYGTPPKVVKGTNALLDGTITLNEGTRINVMSYIGKTYPNKDELPDLMGFHPNALAVLKIHANTPVRLMLRNHAL